MWVDLGKINVTTGFEWLPKVHTKIVNYISLIALPISLSTLFTGLYIE